MASFLNILIFLSIFLNSVPRIRACKGCVNLDEVSFDKILPHFEVVLVKFDVAFPYGDKHEIFVKLASEVVRNKDLLIGEIGVKDYGEKDNEELAKRFGVTKDDFPAIKLFKKGINTPISFPAKTEFTIENLRSFIRDNSNIYLGLPGCLEKYDKLASKFIESKNQDKLINEANKYTTTLDDKDKESAKTYVLIMKKIKELGKSFVSQEKERVTKLLQSKISSKKLVELETRLNILRAFTIPMQEEL